MLSKGDLIDWDELDKALQARLKCSPKSQSDFMTQQMFWESQGSLSSFFTLIDKTLYRNDQFDVPVLLEDILARDKPIIAHHGPEKINWKMMGKDWGNHLKRRPADVTARDWNDRFWDNSGGQEAYFDTDEDGVLVPRDYLRAVTPPKPIDIPEGATFTPRAVEPETVIQQYSLQVSRERQSLPLGLNAKIVHCSPGPLGNRIVLWVQSRKEEPVHQKPSTTFAIFGDNETIAGGWVHVKSLLKIDKTMMHLCVWDPNNLWNL